MYFLFRRRKKGKKKGKKCFFVPACLTLFFRFFFVRKNKHRLRALRFEKRERERERETRCARALPFFVFLRGVRKDIFLIFFAFCLSFHTCTRPLSQRQCNTRSIDQIVALHTLRQNKRVTGRRKKRFAFSRKKKSSESPLWRSSSSLRASPRQRAFLRLLLPGPISRSPLRPFLHVCPPQTRAIQEQEVERGFELWVVVEADEEGLVVKTSA